MPLLPRECTRFGLWVNCFNGVAFTGFVELTALFRIERDRPCPGCVGSHARGYGDACAVPPFVDGRHPDVSHDGAQDEVDRFRDEFLFLAGNTLMSWTIGVCQQVITKVIVCSCFSAASVHVMRIKQ